MAKNTPLLVVFSTLFSVFHLFLVMKHRKKYRKKKGTKEITRIYS